MKTKTTMVRLTTETDPLNADSDGDGISDGDESFVFETALMTHSPRRRPMPTET